MSRTANLVRAVSALLAAHGSAGDFIQHPVIVDIGLAIQPVGGPIIIAAFLTQ
jgi:hypothetical protein